MPLSRVCLFSSSLSVKEGPDVHFKTPIPRHTILHISRPLSSRGMSEHIKQSNEQEVHLQEFFFVRTDLSGNIVAIAVFLFYTYHYFLGICN